MKLRNKKTGEIVEFEDITRVYKFIGDQNTYNSLAELNEDWEDYEEPKGIQSIYYVNHFDATRINGVLIDFETKEEAEKAVEKLKAFKRLQDLGFRFEGIRFRDKHSYIEWKLEPKNELTDDETGKLLEDLYEVFGGKE